MNDCLFCGIIDGNIPVNKIYEDENVLAFYDIDPKAPVHLLIIPKIHMKSILDMNDENGEYIAAMHIAVKKIAKQLGIADSGFRLVINTGKDGGQTVGHLHMHLLGGRSLEWPPG